MYLLPYFHFILSNCVYKLHIGAQFRVDFLQCEAIHLLSINLKSNEKILTQVKKSFWVLGLGCYALIVNNFLTFCQLFACCVKQRKEL